MGNKELVYKPIKKDKKEYLKYFTYEKDENLGGYGYLLKKVRIDINSNFIDEVKEGIEDMYNRCTSEHRKAIESLGLSFEYRLNEDQTSSYYLIMNDAAKEYVSEAYLNIADAEGSLEEMVLATANGAYMDMFVFDCLVEEDKKFIEMLVNERLLKKTYIKVREEIIDINDIIEIM